MHILCKKDDCKFHQNFDLKNHSEMKHANAYFGSHFQKKKDGTPARACHLMIIKN